MYNVHVRVYMHTICIHKFTTTVCVTSVPVTRKTDLYREWNSGQQEDGGEGGQEKERWE